MPILERLTSNAGLWRHARRIPTARMMLSGIGVEFVLTFILTFAIYGRALDPRAPQLEFWAPACPDAVMLMGYPLTGAAVNPARWLGPALWELTLNAHAFRDHAIYWIGPSSAALLAAAFTSICSGLALMTVGRGQKLQQLTGTQARHLGFVQEEIAPSDRQSAFSPVRCRVFMRGLTLDDLLPLATTPVVAASSLTAHCRYLDHYRACASARH